MDFSKYEVEKTLFPYPNTTQLRAEAAVKCKEALDNGEKIYDTFEWIKECVATESKRLRGIYTQEVARLEELFWEDAFKELEISDYTESQLSTLRDIAWDKGHSSGYYAVFSELEDLCYFLQRFGYVHVSETAKAQESRMLSNLVMYAMRYSLGRLTGAFWEVSHAIKYFWSRLDTVTQEQLLKEVKEAPMELPADRVAEHHELVSWIEAISKPKKKASKKKKSYGAKCYD